MRGIYGRFGGTKEIGCSVNQADSLISPLRNFEKIVFAFFSFKNSLIYCFKL
jgi:hypothetical protein